MWQSVLRPLLRISSMSKILFLFFFCPLFWKECFEFWKRCNTFDWGVILFDLALTQLQRWGNFLKLATMKVFHEKKSSKPARWKVLSKTFKGLSQMKDWGKWVWIHHSYFDFRNVFFVSSWYPTYVFLNVRKVQVLAYFLCWIVGSLLINDTLI